VKVLNIGRNPKQNSPIRSPEIDGNWCFFFGVEVPTPMTWQTLKRNRWMEWGKSRCGLKLGVVGFNDFDFQ